MCCPLNLFHNATQIKFGNNSNSSIGEAYHNMIVFLDLSRSTAHGDCLSNSYWSVLWFVFAVVSCRWHTPKHHISSTAVTIQACGICRVAKFMQIKHSNRIKRRFAICHKRDPSSLSLKFIWALSRELTSE